MERREKEIPEVKTGDAAKLIRRKLGITEPISKCDNHLFANKMSPNLVTLSPDHGRRWGRGRGCVCEVSLTTNLIIH